MKENRRKERNGGMDIVKIHYIPLYKCPVKSTIKCNEFMPTYVLRECLTSLLLNIICVTLLATVGKAKGTKSQGKIEINSSFP